MEDWKLTTPILIELEMPQEHKLPNEFMFCFYWIEVG